MHTAWAPFSSDLTLVGLCYSCGPGVDTYHDFNLLGRLGSCVLSVLSGKGQHAALETLPGSEEYSSTLPVLTL